MMGKCIRIWIAGLCLACLGVAMTITACGQVSGADGTGSMTADEMEQAETAAAAPPEETAKETEVQPPAAVDILLTSAPELHLTNTLSGLRNEFALQSGNYEWGFMEKGEILRMVACGMHPLDSVMERGEKLEVPEYDGQDEVLYMVSASVSPDRLTVVSWDASELGNTEAEAEGTETYEGENLLIGLKAGKVYEITAVWEEERLQERGFSGTASYAVITE